MDEQAGNNRCDGERDDDPLALTLGSICAAATAPAPSSPPPQPRSTRRRLNRAGDGDVRPCSRDTGAGDVGRPAPFPWATERPARHDTLETLLRRGVTSVEGTMRCKRCGARKAVAFDLESRFRELRDFVRANRHAMADRAPDEWMFPALLDCAACGHKGVVAPEIAAEKREINWMFLLLGQMLGCCTLEQLKYFCMKTGRHRTGAKNRVLYYAYVEMCDQLEPFDGKAHEALKSDQVSCSPSEINLNRCP